MAERAVPTRPIVALLTDFGTRDSYVGAMKGVVLGVCPEATLVDITHDVPPHDVLGGALELTAAYRYFPMRTVFLAVVDPGVGTSRRPIAVEAGDYYFVAPDNGLLAPVLDETTPRVIVELSNPEYARQPVSRTFEGRDRFAPAAGWLARGTAIESLGAQVTNYRPLDVPPFEVRDEGVSGMVVRVDRFGNLITNLHRQVVDPLLRRGPFRIKAAEHPIGRLVTTYAEAEPGESCALFGSTDHLEIAVRDGNAAVSLGLTRGARVVVSRS